MNVETIPAGPAGTNCYMVHNGTDALIVDPGGEPEKLKTYLAEEGVEPQAILLTHAHFDHIGAVEQLRMDFQIDVYLHADENSWLEDPQLNGSALLLGREIVASPAEQNLVPGHMRIGSIPFEVVHTPGHSPGSVSFIFSDDKLVLGGDVLFNQGIGRTDLTGGDLEQLEQTIRHSLYQLPDDYTVCPGHGPKTAIGEEKQHNPFFPV
ncbi:MBL fold metallo-hydrolase [Barrientosiimonas marina]|uniref:MBL fold metallo-hydrolase n=1 Tax=Lentibacillus kimchii TaxID=1542911 RepID=A0ABW2V0F2_9BACI